MFGGFFKSIRKSIKGGRKSTRRSARKSIRGGKKSLRRSVRKTIKGGHGPGLGPAVYNHKKKRRRRTHHGGFIRSGSVQKFLKTMGKLA